MKLKNKSISDKIDQTMEDFHKISVKVEDLNSTELQFRSSNAYEFVGGKFFQIKDHEKSIDFSKAGESLDSNKFESDSMLKSSIVDRPSEFESSNLALSMILEAV